VFRRRSRQHRSDGGDNLADGDRTFDDCETECLHFLSRQAAECSDNEDTLCWKLEPHFIQGLERLRQLVQIDQQHSRFHSGPAIQPRNRPGVNRNDLVPLLDQLSAQKGTLGPLRAKHDDVRRRHARSVSTGHRASEIT
jgi:hypothetical protein